MGSFGQRLQREREMRSITLEEIALSTKIGTRSLRALEEEDFDQLPGGIFNKGFVRAYAKYLGLDEEQAVADYLSAAGEAEQPLPNPSDQPKTEYSTVREKSNNAVWVTAALVILLAAGGAAGWRWYEDKKLAEAEAAPPPVTAHVTPPTAESIPTPGVTADPSSATSPDAGLIATDTTIKSAPELKKDAAPADGFLLEIRAKRDAWISYTTDDQPAHEVKMRAADAAVAIHAQKRVKLVLGNAGGVEISHNGRTLPQLGPENKPRTVFFTPQGMER